MNQRYDEETEQYMRVMYQQLSEKDRRLYAAIETHKLPRGGQRYIAKVLHCARKTIRRGLDELREPNRLPKKGRIRHPGGGRKRIVAQHPELDVHFETVLAEHTAGSPMNAQVRWTNLTPGQISEHLERRGDPASVYIVKQLLKQHHYVKRKMQKRLPTRVCAGSPF